MQFYCRKEGLSLEKAERFLRLNVKFNVKPDLFFYVAVIIVVLCENGSVFDSTLGSLFFSIDGLSPQVVLTLIVLNKNWKNKMKAAVVNLWTRHYYSVKYISLNRRFLTGRFVAPFQTM